MNIMRSIIALQFLDKLLRLTSQDLAASQPLLLYIPVGRDT